jgi:phosphoserine phosphatase RsbU/P
MAHLAKTVHTLQCMEIVGSNRAAEQLVAAAGLDVWINSRPLQASAGGGDIHYLSSCGSGEVTRLALADISGHGAAVDGIATSLRRLMRKYINTLDQTRFAMALNREFGALAEAGQFATALILTYFGPTNHLIVCNAGHCRPLWHSAQRGGWLPLDAETAGDCQSLRTSRARYHFGRISNLPLGILDPTDYEQFAVRLEPGDFVVVYTDGITESEDSEGRQLGEAGLLELLARLPTSGAALLGEQASAALTARRGEQPATDDCSLIILEHTGSGPPKLTVGRSVRTVAKMLGLSRV